MIHMFDYCRNKLDLNNLDHLACTEIRAANQCHCSFLGAWFRGTASLFNIKKAHQLQRVVEEMMICVKEEQLYDILCIYIKKCNILYGGTIVLIYGTATVFVLGPIFLPISFPWGTEYPFQINYTTINIIIYVHQFFFTYQCAAHTCLSLFGALLLWFATARFECLIKELQKITSIDMLIVCLKKLLFLRRYAEEVVSCIRFLVFYAITISTFILILSGIVMIINCSLFVKIEFITISICLLIQIYIYAWPADHMQDMSIDVLRSAYNSIWYEQTLDMQKTLLIMMTYQKPVTFSINVLLPELTLRYCCSYVSNALSIFTALRAVVEVT
ncbi:odorant receptor 4 isoform X2 [Apis florea]|uniref:odorant receptor 4 isoform X2 n=1 Tax=Apis florea TaxID=7463 RepID=UPI000629CB23|nr:odorant receptor 4 isoform X2 [Apis florea]